MGVMKLENVNSLNSRNFPHLYVCAITQAKGCSTGQGLNACQITTFGSESKEYVNVLERYALLDLARTKVLIQEMADKITIITGTAVSNNLINQSIDPNPKVMWLYHFL